MNKFQIRDGARSKALEATQMWDADKDPNSEKALLWLVIYLFFKTLFKVKKISRTIIIKCKIILYHTF